MTGRLIGWLSDWVMEWYYWLVWWSVFAFFPLCIWFGREATSSCRGKRSYKKIRTNNHCSERKLKLKKQNNAQAVGEWVVDTSYDISQAMRWTMPTYDSPFHCSSSPSPSTNILECAIYFYTCDEPAAVITGDCCSRGRSTASTVLTPLSSWKRGKRALDTRVKNSTVWLLFKKQKHQSNMAFGIFVLHETQKVINELPQPYLAPGGPRPDFFDKLGEAARQDRRSRLAGPREGGGTKVRRPLYKHACFGFSEQPRGDA